MSTSKLHPDEISINKELVSRLIKAQFPQWADLSIEKVNSAGTDNVIFRLGKEMAIRLPRTISAASNIYKEWKWLPILAQQVSLSIPTPISRGIQTKDYPCPWLIYKWLDGKNGTESEFDLNNAAITLGNFIKDLQKVDTSNAPFSQRGGPLSKLDNEVQEALKNLNGIIDADKAKSAWEKALSAPVYTGNPVWIHSDLHAGNILVNHGKITAVIDFGMAGIGDPACDMMAAWTLLSKETRNKFKEIINVDDATWERGKGWALSFGLIALPYYKDTNKVLANIALNTINQVLADYNFNL